MTMKKKVLTTLSVVLILGLAALGILAYLTDADGDVNVMTLGNVDIEQIEQERNDNGLQDFTQDKPALPAVGPIDWADTRVTINDNGYKVFTDDLKNVVDKIVTVKNTGKSDAYVRTIVAIEAPHYDPKDLIHINHNDDEGVNMSAPVTATFNGSDYVIFTFTYEEALAADESSAPSLMQVFLDSKTTNEDCAEFGDTWEILVLSQAVQAEGFENAETALNEAFGKITANNHPWKETAIVDTASELADAIAKGGEIALAGNIEIDANTAITVESGKNVTLDLNGFTIGGTADKTGNQEMFLVKGNMTVKDGNMEMKAENNQEWNAMATIFDVTAGGVLNVEDVKAKVSGTDMNFIVHLNNWGKVTLNANNCEFDTTYVAVRAFNSGYDMNNITIKNTEFKNGRAFFVHNYTSEGKNDSTLNLDIYNNNNTTNNEKPVRFGFSNPVYYDINGNLIP